MKSVPWWQIWPWDFWLVLLGTAAICGGVEGWRDHKRDEEVSKAQSETAHYKKQYLTCFETRCRIEPRPEPLPAKTEPTPTEGRY